MKLRVCIKGSLIGHASRTCAVGTSTAYSLQQRQAMEHQIPGGKSVLACSASHWVNDVRLTYTSFHWRKRDSDPTFTSIENGERECWIEYFPIGPTSYVGGSKNKFQIMLIDGFCYTKWSHRGKETEVLTMQSSKLFCLIVHAIYASDA